MKKRRFPLLPIVGITLISISLFPYNFKKKNYKKVEKFRTFINSIPDGKTLRKKIKELQKKKGIQNQLLAAHSLLLSGNCTDAEVIYRHLLQLKNLTPIHRAKILNNLALARLCQDDKKGAKKLLTKALISNISYRRAKFNLELMIREKKVPPPPKPPPNAAPPPPPKRDPPLKLPPNSDIDLSKFDRFYPYGFLKRNQK